MSEPLLPRVLVVDDDDAIRTMVERVLRREDFEVESARDGEEAIEKLSRNDYGAVLLDLMMPRLDGYGVLRFLETGTIATPAVVVMTANLDSAADIRTAPALRVLPKPFDVRMMVSELRESTAAAVAAAALLADSAPA